jgi:hypothetical protein
MENRVIKEKIISKEDVIPVIITVIGFVVAVYLLSGI